MKTVKNHTKKLLDSMEAHTHAFLFFLGGLFLMVVGPSLIPGTKAAITDISEAETIITEETVKIDESDIKGTFLSIIHYFKTTFMTIFDTIFSKLEELISKTNTIEQRVNELERILTPTNTNSVGGTTAGSSSKNSFTE